MTPAAPKYRQMGTNGAANGAEGRHSRGTNNRLVVALVVGTRPEVIKLAPVLWAFERRAELGQAKIVSTGQQRDLGRLPRRELA